jgi:hypothetical protein
VRLPTAADILQTEALIRSQTESLATVDAEYKATKRKLDLFWAKRNAMMQELLKNKAYLARIRALPQEVLGRVFIFYTDDISHSPWTLMQVNRTWRATALSTRSIWGRIMLTSPAWHKVGASRTKDGRELCGTKEQLDRALRRAGNAALDILISLATHDGRKKYRLYDHTALRAMISLLALSRKCHQVHYLEIDDLGGFNLDWREYVGLEFPQLNTLRVKSDNTSGFIAKISETSKRITEAELLVPYATPSFGLENFIKYSSLTSLHLHGGGGYNAIGPLQRVLDNAPFITTLKLTRVRSDVYNLPAPVFRFSNVRTLILSKGSRPCAFDIPGLTNLTLTEGSWIVPGPPGSNQFPNLASCTIHAPVVHALVDWTRVDPLKDIAIYPLHTLDVCLGKRGAVLSELVTYRAGFSLIVFRLRKTVVPTAILTRVIGAMDRLEELELEEVAIKKDLFTFLASPKPGPNDAISPASRMHCPLLVRLRVHVKGGSQAQNKNIKIAAKKAVKARINAGIAVGSWLVRCAEDKKWTNLA